MSSDFSFLRDPNGDFSKAPHLDFPGFEIHFRFLSLQIGIEKFPQETHLKIRANLIESLLIPKRSSLYSSRNCLQQRSKNNAPNG